MRGFCKRLLPLLLVCSSCFAEQIFRRSFRYQHVPLSGDTDTKVYASSQMSVASSVELQPQASNSHYVISDDGHHHNGYQKEHGDKGLKRHHTHKGSKHKEEGSHSQSGKKGHHDKGSKKYKEHEEKKGYQGHQDSGAKGSKGHDFGKKGHHKKGKNVEGYVKEWTKEESGRAKKFYDDFDLKTHHKKYDDYDTYLKAEEGSHFEGGSKKSHKEHDELGKKKYHREGNFHEKKEGDTSKYDTKGKFSHGEEQSNKGGYVEAKGGKGAKNDDYGNKGASSQRHEVVVAKDFGVRLRQPTAKTSTKRPPVLQKRNFRRRRPASSENKKVVKNNELKNPRRIMASRRRRIPIKKTNKKVSKQNGTNSEKEKDKKYGGFKNLKKGIDKQKKFPIKKYNPAKFKKIRKKTAVSSAGSQTREKPLVYTLPDRKSKNSSEFQSILPSSVTKNTQSSSKIPEQPNSINDKLRENDKENKTAPKNKSNEYKENYEGSESDSSKGSSLIPLKVIDKKKGQQVSSVSSQELKQSETSKHHGKGKAHGKPKSFSKHEKHEEGHHLAHGEKGVKGGHEASGYKRKDVGDHSKKEISNFHDKGKKHYDGEEHKKQYGGEHDAGKKAKKGHSYGTKGHHKKGHSDKGFKDVHHKFEYAMKKKFFDDYEDHDHHKKYDDFDAYFDKHVKSNIKEHEKHGGHFHDEFGYADFFDDDFFKDDHYEFDGHYGDQGHHDFHQSHGSKGNHHKSHKHGYKHGQGGHGDGHGGHGHGEYAQGRHSY